ncbi:hypothetical protein IB254_01775 [Pseudomonas sp. PDM03]|uniref:hypothetical protein n=1 Tax=unclassified Pseudomonas TaxID=196821 RepID=UPI00177BF7EE|nr:MULTISPECIES: hypothetical protein [unclassified Pseudomonas]MBD9585773.1 hypothetical protein [Pseudomonas sp. PDM03]
MSGNIVECPYETGILKHRRMYFLFVITALMIPIATCLMVVAMEKPSMWIARSGALMACAAFLAHLQVGGMRGSLSVSLSGPTYYATRTKYFRQIGICDQVAIATVILGSVVWGFGDLLPVGAA